VVSVVVLEEVGMQLRRHFHHEHERDLVLFVICFLLVYSGHVIKSLFYLRLSRVASRVGDDHRYNHEEHILTTTNG